jgi:hypothetical protein
MYPSEMVDSESPKDPNAVALGRKGGLKGGRARAAALTPEARSEGAKRAADARWSAPQALHSGTLTIGNLVLPCYVLDDERRVFTRTGIIESLNMSDGGQGNTGLGHDRLARFIQGRAVSVHVPRTLEDAIRAPFRFRLPPGADKLNDGMALGYEATVLVELCQAILKAKDQGTLQTQQQRIAKRADILIRGFATVGVVALVDEATGYQYVRARRNLAEILEQFIAKELAKWAKTFDDEYYSNLFRLRGGNAEDITKRPGYFGHLTNDIVYHRLAPGVVEELRKKNPRTESGTRRSKHHQWLTPAHGHPKLREHLARVIALMTISDDYESFIGRLDRVAPKFESTLHLFSVEAMQAKPLERTAGQART